MLKKILITFIAFFITITFVCINFNFEVSADADVDDTFLVKMFCEDDIDLSQVKLSIYKAIETENSDDVDFKQYNETFDKDIYLCKDGHYRLNNISNRFSVTVDLKTLPIEYAIDQQTKFCTKEEEVVYFYLKKITDVQVDINNLGKYDVKILSNGTPVICDYRIDFHLIDENIDITQTKELNYYIDVNINGQHYEIIKKQDMSNFTLIQKYAFLQNIGLINEGEVPKNIQEKNSYGNEVEYLDKDESLYNSYTSYVQNGFYRVCFEPTADAEFQDKKQMVAQKIADFMALCESFYIDLLGYTLPYSTKSDSYFSVYVDIANSEVIKYGQGTTYKARYSAEDSNYIYSSYITLELNNYDTFTEEFWEYILSICIHEYFHSITLSYGFDDTWFMESTAAFMTIYYMDIYRGIQNLALAQRYGELASYFMNSLDSLFEVGGEVTDYVYGAMLFHLYLYQKSNNDIDIMKFILNNYDYSNKYSVFETIAAQQGMSFDELFTEFCIYKADPVFYFNSVSKFYTSLWQYSAEKKVSYGNLTGQINIGNVSSNIIILENGDYNDAASISLTIDLKEDFNENLAIYMIEKHNTSPNTVTRIYPESNRITISLPYWQVEEGKEKYLVFVNTGRSSANKTFVTCNLTIGTVMKTESLNRKGVMKFDLNEYLTGNQEFIKIDCIYPNFYQFELVRSGNELLFDYLNNNVYREGTIKLLDKDMNEVVKSSYIGNDIATSKAGQNSIIAYVNNTRNINGDCVNYYYLQIKKNSTERKYEDLIVKRVTDEVTTKEAELSYQKNLQEVTGDQFALVKFLLSANANITLDINTNGYSSTELRVVIIEKAYGYYRKNSEFVLSETQNHITLNETVNENDYYIILFLDGDGNNDVCVNIDLELRKDFDIILDKEGEQEALMGSEVNANDGIRESNIITQGLTRCIFLGTDAPESSRLDYTWLSSDTSIATVSIYGTIVGVGKGTAIIQGIYKYGITSKHSYILVEVKQDLSTEIKYFNITTDQRSDPTIVGTEVSSGLGVPGETTISVGKTRYISLCLNAPIQSIQDYAWSSSDSSIATVSGFGTILGKSRGTVTITGVYLKNRRFQTTLEITVY